MRYSVSLFLPIKVLLLAWLLISRVVTAELAYDVGVEDVDYAPHYAFGYQRSAAEEILTLFATQASLNFHFKPMELSKLYHHFLNSGELDFKYPDNPVWNAEAKKGKIVYYSEPVLPYCDGIMLSPSESHSSMADLKWIGIVKGFTPEALSPHLQRGGINLLSTTDSIKLIEAALNNRVDGIYLNIDVGNYLLNTRFYQKVPTLSYDASLPHTCGNYYLSTTKFPHIIVAFNTFLSQHREQINDIKERFKIIP